MRKLLIVALLLIAVPSHATWKGYHTEHKSYGFVAPGGGGSTNYVAGAYYESTTDANLTQASATVNLGTANIQYAAHAFVVAGAAGSASGGSGTVTLVVSGTSITDAGTRTPGDSQTVVTDITAESTDAYTETPKKWIGQVTYTLTCTGGCTHTTYSFDFNYGFAKYDDWGNIDFDVQKIECTGRGSAADSSFDIQLIHHKATGWTYAASGFVPGPAAFASSATDHSTESDLANGHPYAWKRVNLDEAIKGDDGEGLIIRVITGAANSVTYTNCHLGVDWGIR
jgi:hypothetical protein